MSFINNCSNAGLASNGFSLLPVNEYVSFTSALAPRVMSGPASDIGAYEFNSGVGVNENKSQKMKFLFIRILPRIILLLI
ncbi:MAG: hypothetical protein IPJ32_21735 [Sphingobacteriaceae bacterium]|nr:hypothetical protein [Sphingobacteriaceae bacterium]